MYKCPNCGSTDIDHFRSLTGKMWCYDCNYSIARKEIPDNPFKVVEEEIPEVEVVLAEPVESNSWRHDIPLNQEIMACSSILVKDEETFIQLMIALEHERYLYRDGDEPTNYIHHLYPVYVNLDRRKYIELGDRPEYAVVPFIKDLD